MFVSVKERARQIANGHFIAASAPVASLIDIAPEAQPTKVSTPKKSSVTDSPTKAGASPSKSKSSKAAPSKEPTPKAAPSKATPPPAVITKSAPKSTPASEPSTPKKSSSKSNVTKDSIQKPSSPKIGSPKIGSPKLKSTKKATSEAKIASPAKVTPPTKTTPTAKSTASKISTTPLKSKRSKSPPKRVDSPIEDDEDPLSTLKSACLKQVSGVTGLGGRRLAIVLKQRSSGEWYAALKDTGSDKYLKMWMNRDKTSPTKEEALEAYLVFVTKMKNEVRWFPMSPRASSPKGKGK